MTPTPLNLTDPPSFFDDHYVVDSHAASSIPTHGDPYRRPNPQPRQTDDQRLGALDQRQDPQANVPHHLSEPSNDDTDDEEDDLVYLGNFFGKIDVGTTRPDCTVLPDPEQLKRGYFDVELHDHTYMRVVCRENGCITGTRFQAQHHPELLMPEADHELVLLSHLDDRDLTLKYCDYTVHESQIARFCQIIITNQPYGNLNYTKHVQGPTGQARPIFFCRYMSAYINLEMENHDKPNVPYNGRIERHREHNIEWYQVHTGDGQVIDTRIPDRDVRKQWRGKKRSTLSGSRPGRDNDPSSQQYTFGDAFCGAGGTSVGAYKAGLRLKYAFDFDETAIRTYRKNFQQNQTTGMDVYLEDVAEFVDRASQSRNFHVDVLHMSPPCQPFCAKNTHPNEENKAKQIEAFRQVRSLVEHCKPRIATLEETIGLTYITSREHFHQLISFFVEHEYSLQWKVVNVSEFGVAQKRERLVVIASAPGEPLPPFPKATHGNQPGLGLDPLPTIEAAIADIPADATLHDILEAADRRPKKQKTVDPNGLSHTIMCAGNTDTIHHPCGHAYTIRELARLQSFPDWVFFAGGCCDDHCDGDHTLRKRKKCIDVQWEERYRQIGNAVPPLFAELLFRHLKWWLEEVDKAEGQGKWV